MKESNFILPKKIDHYLALLSKLYSSKGETELQRLIVNGTVRIEEGVDYNNWDGGQHGHDVFLELPEVLFLSIVGKKESLEKRLITDLRNITNNMPHEYFNGIFLESRYTPDGDWRNASGLLIKPTRSVTEISECRIKKGDPFKVFLSHKTEVKCQTAKLKKELEEYGLVCFVAHEDIEPTQEWQNEIENALFSTDALVALLTENFHDSNWTDQEVGIAFGRKIPIISAKIDRDPYGFIGKFQAVACTWEGLAVNILKILFQRYDERLIDSYITSISRCRSWDEGNKLAKILPYIKDIPEGKAEQLIKTVYANTETTGSYGFNGKSPKPYGLGINHYFKEWTGKDYIHNEEYEEGITTTDSLNIPT